MVVGKGREVGALECILGSLWKGQGGAALTQVGLDQKRLYAKDGKLLTERIFRPVCQPLTRDLKKLIVILL